ELQARLLGDLEHYQDALASLDKALELKSDNYNLWELQARLLLELEHYQDALASLDKALELKSDDYNLWNYKTITLYKLKFYDKAIESAKKSIYINPENSNAWNSLGYLLLIKYSNDEPQLNIPLAINYEQVYFHDKQENSFEESKYYEESLIYFDKAVIFGVNDENFVLYLANQSYPLYYLDRYQEALAICKKCIKLNFKKDIVWGNQGFILLKLGRYTEAIKSFKQVLKLNIHYANIHYSIACCYALRNNVKEAVKTLKEAIAINSKCRERAKLDSNFDKIRKDRRFQKLMQTELYNLNQE
ncbi:MAG: tetratricopeptide repeat protein, partial [Nostoc sp.]|uniref:tetratricopeptide repeat protein n=1 Tax=Nostoc sp. TaxID=1180 RepID=UPI002FF53BF8